MAEFVEVSESQNPTLLCEVETIFTKVLKPLYGSQEKAIRQIRESADRRCFLLRAENVPAGVLVFKTNPTNEYEDFDVKQSIEVKSLFLCDEDRFSGQGLGTALINKLLEEVLKIDESISSVHVTVSEKVNQSLKFFQKKGFEIVHEWHGRYIPDVKEFLLVKRLEPSKMGVCEAKETASNLPRSHFGDIHVIQVLSDGSFLSGSKDNSIIKWSNDGTKLSEPLECEPTLATEKNWITAIEVLNDRYWLSGMRSGKINLWKTDGTKCREIKVALPKKPHDCKPENYYRPCCIKKGFDEASSFFVGFPTMFAEFSIMENKTISYTPVDGNDWTYCLDLLSSDQLLAVVGTKIGLWGRKTNEENSWKHHAFLVNEQSGKLRKGAQRPFISSLVTRVNHMNLIAYSTFQGKVKTFDLETKQQVADFVHSLSSKVWKCISLEPNVLASCGEDGELKLFDIRERPSITGRSIFRNKLGGEINTICALNSRLIAAGCSRQGGNEGIVELVDIR